MEADFWHKRWQKNQIGFHRNKPHRALKKHWKRLGLVQGERVFVPLCGKSLDLVWLAKQGHHVIGIELSEIAACDFFAEQNLEPKARKTKLMDTLSHNNITIHIGDYFNLTQEQMKDIKAVYDRAALIALPDELRQDYVNHQKNLLKPGTQILLITLEFDQSKKPGPPFSIQQNMVEQLYANWCDIKLLDRNPPKDFPQTPAMEAVYLMEVR